MLVTKAPPHFPIHCEPFIGDLTAQIAVTNEGPLESHTESRFAARGHTLEQFSHGAFLPIGVRPERRTVPNFEE